MLGRKVVMFSNKPEMSWIGSGISIDKENQLGFESRAVMHTVGLEAPLFPVKPAKPFPKVGDKLTIRHQVNRNKQGDVIGLNRNDRPYADKITAVYMDGTVRTGISDVWSVRPATNNSWETINPDREEK